jgi:hypothetical protein
MKGMYGVETTHPATVIIVVDTLKILPKLAIEGNGAEGRGVLQDLRIFRGFWELDQVAFQVLHEIVLKPFRSRSLRALFLAPMDLNSKLYWSLL